MSLVHEEVRYTVPDSSVPLGRFWDYVPNTFVWEELSTIYTEPSLTEVALSTVNPGEDRDVWGSWEGFSRVSGLVLVRDGSFPYGLG